MKIKTVRGTNDYLPYEMRIRDYLQKKILETYTKCGFERIATPIMESIENLDKSEGGENLNLIFKILQRGEKLTQVLEAKDYEKLADMGLRYDLTLPLARYFANNRANLLMPLKSIQIDRAFRAERPQKGRLREFIQCDIELKRKITSEIKPFSESSEQTPSIPILSNLSNVIQTLSNSSNVKPVFSKTLFKILLSFNFTVKSVIPTRF